MVVKVKKTTPEKTEEATAKPTTLSSAQISQGVAKFVQVSPLSPKNVDESPKYSDEAETIYLQLSSSTISGDEGYLASIALPHPLSSNRSVCLFLKDEAALEHKAKFVAEMKEFGITDFKVVYRDDLESAINEKNTDELEEIVKTYDSLLPDKFTVGLLAKAMAPTLNALGKNFNYCKIHKLLQNTAMFVIPSSDCYSIKIGHTGFSKKQLLENIEAAIAKIMYWGRWFPLGLGHFKTVTLKTGTTPGIDIFTNNGEVVPEPPREKRSDAERELRSRKRSAEAPPKIQESAKKQKVENLTEASATPATEGKKKQKIAKKLGQKQNKQIKKQQAAASPDSSSVQLSKVGMKMKNKKKKQNAAAAIPESSSLQLSTVGKKMKNKKKRQSAAAAI